MATQEERAQTARWLASPQAVAPLAAAEAAWAARPRDPLAAGTLLRAQVPDLLPDRAAAVLEQAELRALAMARYGVEGTGLLLTRDGLEQATRPAVAERRARLFVSAGARRVLDLTGGLGFDTAAFLAAGLAVSSVERDPVIATYLAHNCPGAVTIVGDATDRSLVAVLLSDLGADDVVFVDPGRRDPTAPRVRSSGRSHPERDPERWSPPWPYVEAIDHPRITAKVAPGFRPPDSWQAEWVSVERTIVECATSSWAVAGSHRQAVIIGSGPPLALPSAPPCPVAPELGAWLHEPDPAVLRAGAVGSLSLADPGLGAVDPLSSWLTSDRPWASPAARSYRVVVELTGSPRRQRRQLADLGVARATVKSRDVSVDPQVARRELGISEGPEWVVVMTHRSGRALTVLTQPAAARSG